MRIQDILVESQQLDEGPILNKIGTGIGKLAGGAAKAVGAVAGGIAGAGQAIKKGYQAGKQTVAGAGDDEEPAAAGTAPAAPGRLATAFKAGNQYAKGAMAAGQKPSMIGAADAGVDSTPAAPTRKAAAQPAAGGGAAPAGAAAAPGALAAQPAAGAAPAGSMYAQVKSNIDKLDKKGKQRILAALQKEVGAAPAAKPTAAPAAGAPAAPGAVPAQPTTMAQAPVSKTNTAKPGNPNAQAAPAAGSNAGADAFGQMAKNLTQKPEPQQQKVPPKKKAAAAPTAAPAPAAAPSGEKTIANPVATVGTKRATDIGKQTFDTQTGKALPGQSINAIRKKAEYGTGALGAARKRIKAGAAAPAESKTNTRPALSEGFSLFRKK
jgi:hypothetical protein